MKVNPQNKEKFHEITVVLRGATKAGNNEHIAIASQMGAGLLLDEVHEFARKLGFDPERFCLEEIYEIVMQWKVAYEEKKGIN